MAVSRDSIISKMQQELQTLQNKTPSKTEFRQHIGNVKLMCELLLENEMDDSGENQTRLASSEDVMEQYHQQTPDMTEAEYNVMIKGKDGQHAGQANHPLKKKHDTHNDLTNHDGANGDSIFDF